jgi:carbohydrate kinase (thermoresistant glucokinase family)
MTQGAAPRLSVIVMGVSSSGKCTFGSALARATGLDFVDGDDLHPSANIDKMRRGEPLDDADRAPWLREVARVLADDSAHPAGVVVACSSLKRAYRDALREVGSLCRAVRRYLVPSGYLVIQTLHPVAACGDHPYRDGWRQGNWSGFGPEFSDPAPWFFRTLSSWLALLRRSGYRLTDCREPTAPCAASPSSIIFVGQSAAVHD